MTAAPYVSIVTASRNDDHGGNLLPRMQTFVNALLDQCREQSLALELIVVEWNPPPDRPRLADALRWTPGPCEIRIIEVPAAVHARYRHADLLPLYQMIGKNVGIRRARGEFVLATNIDVLFSTEFIRRLAARDLEKGVMYRLDRHDVHPAPPVEASIADRLAFCAGHRVRINNRIGSYALNADGSFVPESVESLQFRGGWHLEEQENGRPFRWAGNHCEILLPKNTTGGLSLEVEPGPGVRWRPFDLEIVPNGTVRIERRSLVKIPLTGDRLMLRVPDGGYVLSNDDRVLNFKMFNCAIDPAFTGPITAIPTENSLRPLLRRFRASRPAKRLEDMAPIPPPTPEPPLLHTIASGDFMLLDRENWMKLRGYAEFDVYSMNLDSLSCWAAYKAGIREEILQDPIRMYHIDHGAGWTPETSAELFARMDKIGLPWIGYPEVVEMVESGRIIFNDEDWGLASEPLPDRRM